MHGLYQSQQGDVNQYVHGNYKTIRCISLVVLWYYIEQSTTSMRLAGKASLPAGGPFIVLVPAGGPAVGPFVYFWAIVRKCVVSRSQSFFSQQPRLLTTSADFVSYLVLSFHRYTTAPSPKLSTPPPALPRRRRSRCCCCCCCCCCCW